MNNKIPVYPYDYDIFSIEYIPVKIQDAIKEHQENEQVND